MELLDIVDRNGEPTGETVERETAHLEGIPHRTSHVWLLRKKGSRVQVLLQKRSRNKDSFPGCLDISSAGHIPAGCGFRESAVRELKEELGVMVPEEELIFCGIIPLTKDGFFHGAPFHDRQISAVFVLWKDMEESEFILQKEELESVLWMDLEACMKAVLENSITHCMFYRELEMIKAAVKGDAFAE